MRIVIIDSDVAFTSAFSQRCKKANVFCQVFPQSPAAIAEIKKDPDGVDIILLSKELGGGEDGLVVAQTLRKDPKTSDVPYIIMSTAWGKPDFAKHQKTEFGANAYHNKKTSLGELEATIEAVTGFKFPPAAAEPKKKEATTTTTTGGVLNVQLQVASDVVNFAEEVPGGISMEQPIDLFGDGEAPAIPDAAPAIPTIPSPSMNTNSGVTTPSQVSLQMEVPTGGTSVMAAKAAAAATPAPAAPVAAAPAPSQSAGVEISIDPSADFQLETTNKPVASTPAPAPLSGNTQVTTKTPVTESSLEISMTPMPAMAAPTPAPALVEEPKLEMPAPVAAPVAVAPSVAPDVEPAFSISGAEQAQAPQPVLASPTPNVEASISTSTPAVSEEEAARDLPYLFAGPAAAMNATRSIVAPSPASMSAPVDLPVGGPLSNDVETLKKYLTMREQDVSVLTAQLTYAKEELGKSEETIKRLTLQGEDLYHQINDLKKRVEAQDQELLHANRNKEGELEQLRFEVKSKIDRIKFVEDRLNDSAAQYEKLKERVRLDIRKIRVREKELESKLEILKKDSETLIAARENKILELKRKIDLLEFNYDTLQDKNELEKQNVRSGQEKMERIQKVLKLALGIIEADEQGQTGRAPEENAA